MFKMKNAAFFLVIIFAICALLLTFTINQTKEPILEAQQKHKDALLAEIYPLASAQKMQQISDSIWLVCENKKVQGEIHKVVSDRAYADKISLLVGTKDGQIKAVRVISHSETPGLGDRIENRKSTWIDQFSLKSLKTQLLTSGQYANTKVISNNYPQHQ